MLRILGYKLGTRNLFLSTQSQNIYFGKTRTPEGIAYGRDQQQKLRDIFENEIEEKIYKDNMKSSERPVSSPVSPARILGLGEIGNIVMRLFLDASIQKQTSKISFASRYCIETMGF